MNQLLAVAIWAFLMLTALVQHEFAHAALQKAEDPDTQFAGLTVLGVGKVQCSPGEAGCVIYYAQSTSPYHLLIDIEYQVFFMIMLAYPIFCPFCLRLFPLPWTWLKNRE